MAHGPTDRSIWEHLQSLPVLLGLLVILALMILPIPAFLLDTLLAVNITLSVLVLLTAIYILRPLDFSGLPALLLVATLFRLGLNVASTRLILLGASEGQSEVGKIITTFGDFVVGGNSLVGIIVFLVLVIINFMVITKGAGRIAEVAARFTLDALPGKQMSIDAELAAGVLDEESARKKREEVSREADFYGAMDGASKFVRGDAIAGLIIVGINILGGLFIGVVQGGLPVGQAMQTYTILTVGDGLVSQIPALFISTATGIVVTRVASSTRFTQELSGEMLGSPAILFSGATVSLVLGLVPGMPFLIFFAMGGAMAALGYRLLRLSDDPEESQEEAEEALTSPPEATEEELQGLLHVETLALEVGFGLVHLVQQGDEDSSLLHRLVQMRRQFAATLGVVVPPIHIRDNLELPPGGYRLLLKGQAIGVGELMPGRLLAIDPGLVEAPVTGIPTKDPTFGLDALWIDSDQRHRAEAVGYTVVDLNTVVTTHVSELLKAHSADLLGWPELEDRVQELKKVAPSLVDELIPERLRFGQVLQVLRQLLAEQVSIRDLRTIFEALSEAALGDTTIHGLVGEVRARLARQISATYATSEGVIHTALLDRDLEDRLRQCLVRQHGEPTLACDLTTAQTLFAELEKALPEFSLRDVEAVILAPPDLRGPLKKFLMQFFPNVDVICHREVITTAQIVSVAQLGLPSEDRPTMTAA